MLLDRVDVLVLGDANPDLVLRGGQVEPAFHQTERLVGEAILTIGGSGSIFACAAAELGLRVALIGVVGEDLFGAFMKESLKAHGVDVRALVIDATESTGVSIILLRDEDRAILTFPGTSAKLEGRLVDRSSLRSIRHLHVSSYFLQKGLHPDLPALLTATREAGATTSIDPNWDPSESWNGELLQLLELTDVFLPNATEAKRIAATDSVEEAAAKLARRGPAVAVKLGEKGALAVEGDQMIRADALEVSVTDTIGAGDSFDAGFIAGRLAGWPLERCLSLAIACGSLSTREIGGTAAQPTLEEALTALESP